MRDTGGGRERWQGNCYSFHSVASYLIGDVAHCCLLLSDESGDRALLSKCSVKDNSSLKCYFSNGKISNTIFCEETLLRGLFSTNDIWLKLCPHHLGGMLEWVTKVFILTTSSGHFSTPHSQVYSALGPTILWVYLYPKMKCVLIPFSSKVSIFFFYSFYFSTEKAYLFSYYKCIFLHLIKHNLVLD